MMTLLGLLLSLTSLHFTHAAGTADRDTVVYGQLGTGQSYQNFSGDSRNSSFKGSAIHAEIGTDLLVGDNMGLNLAATYADYQLSNTGNSSTSSETGKEKSYGAKAGLFLGVFTAGAGYRHLKLDTTAVTTNNSSSVASAEGSEMFVYADVTFNIAKKFRASFEVNHGSGKSSGLNTSSTHVILRLGIIQDWR